MVATPPVRLRYAKLTLSLAVAAADWTLGRWHSASVRQNGGVVLYYHAVRPEHRNAFARQMDWIMRRAVPWRLDSPPPTASMWVGISFDDAYVSVWENALPELAKRHLPCTIFVPTGSLGCRPSWVHSAVHPYWQEQVMSAKQIRLLAQKPGIVLGSHTVTHPNLTRISREEVKRELTDSRRALEDLTERPVDLFSFPYGAWTPDVVELAREAGYRRLFGIQPACLHGRELPELVGRVSVEPTDWPLEFRLKVLGCYRWLAWLSQWP